MYFQAKPVLSASKDFIFINTEFIAPAQPEMAYAQPVSNTIGTINPIQQVPHTQPRIMTVTIPAGIVPGSVMTVVSSDGVRVNVSLF